ncbi:cell division protein CrgA [Demequina sp. NBRC 110053]|uniref:cell division protein CrgA n=1 Tax=Demequina sp. NBRC 110053 TaxID=1570342 RepID=UPI001F1F894D|nr:cell division protein CrgA [Demequina sp. NBRC 110053]
MALKKKRDDDNQAYKAPRNVGKPESDNPRWLLPTAVTLLVIGPVWIVVYYISKGQWPAPIGDANLLVGFAFMAAAMVLFTRWK